jgi:hypothetical protein
LVLAVVILSIAAGVIVWRGNDAPVTGGALPPQIESLAQLIGF